MSETGAPTGEMSQVWSRLKNVFIAITAFSFFISALVLVPSVYMLQVYDRVLTSRNVMTLWMLTALVLALYALMSALEWLRSKLLARAGVRLEEELRERVFTAAFESNLLKAGTDPRQAIADLSNLRNFLTGRGLLSLLDIPWSPLYLTFLFLLHPVLGWFAVAGVFLLVSLAVVTEVLTHARLSAAGDLWIQSGRLANNQLANAEVIQAMGMLPALRNKWSLQHNRALALQTLAGESAGFVVALTKFVRITLQSLILGLGAYLVITDGVSGGAMIASSILMGRALAPIEGVIATWRSVVSTRDAYARLVSLLTRFPVVGPSMPLPKPRGWLKLEAVAVVPPGAKLPSLQDIGFELQAGECLVVIGPSGSGKSSLARVLVGVWKPTNGSVRLDGADVFSWNKAELGPWLGYLPQDVELFEGTVAENIARFGNVDAEKVRSAALSSGIHDLILKLPQGYDTQIGAGGGSLSGGQRQRLGLARALYGDPAFLVLDEPNSNLDESGEMALASAVKDLKARGKTVVLITHRRNIVNLADRLLVLRDGGLQGFGPRDLVLDAMQRSAQQGLAELATTGARAGA